MKVFLRGTSEQAELIEVSTADPEGPLPKVNPLGKVPVLDTGADGIIHDSPVICEYLDGYTSCASGAGRGIDLAWQTRFDVADPSSLVFEWRQRLAALWPSTGAFDVLSQIMADKELDESRLAA